MKFSKIAGALALCVALVGWANGACAQKNPADITIGYSAMQLSNPWYISVRWGMVAACRKLGIKCVIIDAQNRVDKQVSDLQNMVDDRFDAIACTPLDSEALQDLYAQANAQGIITGSLAQVVPGSHLEYGIDEYHYGYEIGKQAAEWARNTLQCRGKVALITQDNVLATVPRAD
ncbi:MAG: substrate-binding domain-containing protein, partial [Anaerobiospirillum sp.]|nr:substrate-binding domain-containing protein [Anaerobiospirillum sp.]